MHPGHFWATYDFVALLKALRLKKTATWMHEPPLSATSSSNGNGSYRSGACGMSVFAPIPMGTPRGYNSRGPRCAQHYTSMMASNLRGPLSDKRILNWMSMPTPLPKDVCFF